jgi:ATP-dependent helicase/nuclease subunit B
VKHRQPSQQQKGKISEPETPAAHTRPALVELVPYEQDPLRMLAGRLLAPRHTTPPDLRRAVVLLPHRNAVTRFRSVLLELAAERGFDALLPPVTATLTGWVQRFAGTQRYLGNDARELLLLEALNEHPALSQRWGAWALIDSLLALFDEISINRSRVPDDLDSFTRLLATGYGMPDPLFAPLTDEAHLVHTLWVAWKRQLAAEGAQDATERLLQGLRGSLQQLPSDRHLYLAGFVQFTQAELDWIAALQSHGRLTLLLHGQSGASGYHPDALITQLFEQLDAKAPAPQTIQPYTRFLNNVFSPEGVDMLERAQHQATTEVRSPARERLIIHEAIGFEDEARAIEVQVRRWRLQGLHNIGIVTNDRKLARRVRALLERANAVLQDRAGWRLSTSSAASALARWLECIEQDFAYGPLLDLLRSPFSSFGLTSVERSERILCFEEGVVLRHNVGRTLRRYQRALQRDGETFDHRYQPGAAAAVAALLDSLESAAAPLAKIKDGRPHPAQAYLTALTKSLDSLGLIAAYREDEAGIAVLNMFAELEAALVGRRLRLKWSEFAAWLRRSLERRRFQPPDDDSNVQLMAFDESRLHHFDAVVIAGALREHLPGHIERPPLFNDGVRRQLRLPSLLTQRNVLFHDFRRLLEAAPRIVISLRREQDGERLTPSPWVERVRAFHQVAYGQSLDDFELARHAQSTATEVIASDPTPLPEPHGYPAPMLPPALIDSTLSATAHQRLLDCPYQYFAVHGLSLTLPEEVHEQLEKREYGQRVHQILQAFHAGVPGLPGPFRQGSAGAARQEARQMLADIGEAVFAPDIRENILARGWLLRWRDVIATYVEWQLARETIWSAMAAELPQRHTYENGNTTLTLTARIDRLDHGEPGYAIIDYKTGHVPGLADVLAGEQVQLPFYALAIDRPVAQALYLDLSGTTALDKTKIEGNTLSTLTAQVRARLSRIYAAMRRGATALPAWGDDDTCLRCPMQGLCRKEMWIDETAVKHAD